MRLLLATGLALVALPATSLATTPPAGALFGGGAIGPEYLTTSTYDVTWVNARVAKDQKTVRFYGDVDLKCGTEAGVFVLTSATVPLKSGRFSGSYTIEPA